VERVLGRLAVGRGPVARPRARQACARAARSSPRRRASPFAKPRRVSPSRRRGAPRCGPCACPNHQPAPTNPPTPAAPGACRIVTYTDLAALPVDRPYLPFTPCVLRDKFRSLRSSSVWEVTTSAPGRAKSKTRLGLFSLDASAQSSRLDLITRPANARTLGATSVAAVRGNGCWQCEALGAAACATNSCQTRRTAHAVEREGCPSHACDARQPLDAS
jgi:hypothetical protein